LPRIRTEFRVRAGASLSKIETQTRREGGVEPPQRGL